MAQPGGAREVSDYAGIRLHGSAGNTTPELCDEVMGVNLRGAGVMAPAPLPQLADRPQPSPAKPSGWIAA
ncbi:hypothetical protein ROA7023_02714 [Roseisalinus antarcticus]|uniref:Uncharacterized protein n=1 Tax=Roseisalinus antarcticus TaxID=254357 RepID=A0A1Y5TD62_9RHOB|nr:hypothetical protein ROA7023_02714 [Roseisalinus antarcticus]